MAASSIAQLYLGNILYAIDATVSPSANRTNLHRLGTGAGGRWSRLLHLDDDRRDVVESAASIRLGDQRLHLALRLGTRAKELTQPAVVHHARQAVAGDEKEIARAHFAAIDVRLDIQARAHAARDDVAVRVVARLLRRQESRVYLFLDVGVILRELRQRTVAHQIDAGVAHLADEITRAGDEQHRRGRPHPLLVHLGEGAIVDR